MSAIRFFRRRSAVVLFSVLALVLAVLPAASAWDDVSEVVAPQGLEIATKTQLQIADDGSALYMRFDPQESYESGRQIRLVQRAGTGDWKLAKKFPSGFSGLGTTYNDFLITRPDASGSVLVYNSNGSAGVNQYVHLAKGQNPATTVPKATAGEISKMDMNRAGVAASMIRGTGNIISVHRRPAGPDTDFELVGQLSKMDADRSYAVDVAVDPDGGIFVLYRTEQPSALYQAYAPPGQGFGPPVVVPNVEHQLDFLSLKYAQSTNGRGALVWQTYRTAYQYAAASKEVMLATRTAGGLLGTAMVIDEMPPEATHQVDANAVAIKDNGEVYIAHSRWQYDSGCSMSSQDRGIHYYFSRVLGSQIDTVELPASDDHWQDRMMVDNLQAAGNHLVALVRRSKNTGERCSGNTKTSYELLAQRSLAGKRTSLLQSGTASVSGKIVVDGVALTTTGLAVVLTSSVPNGSTERVYRVFSDPSINPAPNAKPNAGSAKVSESQKLSNNTITVMPKCGSASGACKVKVTVKVKSGKKYMTAGSTSKNVEAKKSTNLKVKLSKKAVKQIKKAAKAKKESARTVPAKVTVTITKKGAKTYKKTFTLKVRV